MLFTSGSSTIGNRRLGQVSWILQHHFWRDLFSMYIYRFVSVKWIFVHLYMYIILFWPLYNLMMVFFAISNMYIHICESFLVLVSTIFDFLDFFSHLKLHPCRCKESPRLLVICWLQLWWVSSREVSVQTWMTTKESGGKRRWSWSYGNGFFVGPCPGCDPLRKHVILVVTIAFWERGQPRV